MGRSSNPFESLKRSVNDAANITTQVVSGGTASYKDGKIKTRGVVDDAANAAVQGTTMGTYSYKDGSVERGGYTTDAIKGAANEAMSYIGEMFAAEDTPGMGEGMADVEMKVESPDNAADAAARDKELAAAAKLDERRKRSNVGSSRAANLLQNKGKTLNDDDELSVSSLLA